jgi:cell wall-associated NlpC family hydrolase
VTDSLAGVQARVAELQALIGVRPTVATTSASATSATAGTSAVDGSAFADILAKAGLKGGDATESLGEKAITIAKKYLGIDYRWGGTDPRTGLDCSGLTRLVYGQVGVGLPRTSAAQSHAGTKVNSLAQAEPGDLVFFGSPVHHVGIYLGGGKMLDAPHTGAKVQIRKVYETPSAIRRVLPEGPVSSLNPAGLSGAVATGKLAGTPYADLFTAAGKKYGVDPALLSAIAEQESAYRPDAVSHAGARGLMQLMPATARSLGVNPDLPAQAVDGAARLMSDLMKSFNGRVDLALAGYNAGPGAVRKYGGIPPFEETQNYVKRVTANWGALR